MSGTWGKNVRFSIFGESHGVAIGGVIDGIKAGFEPDFEEISYEMQRRNHRAFYSTPRDEKDQVEILSGIRDGICEGTPIAFVIRNKEQNSKDYVNLNVTPRPGHADYPSCVKYGGFNDYRGGGHSSGRITAPLTFAGAMAKQILACDGIQIFSHIYSIGSVVGKSLLDCADTREIGNRLHNMQFPVLDEELCKQMEEEINKYKSDQNSIGGIIECVVNGIPAGIGAPFFDSVESEISKLMFSIPAVKGVEFGKGFDISRMNGLEANDAYRYQDGKIVAKSNNNGGICGGITNGMPIVFKVAIKPTPSVFKTQDTVNLQSQTDDTITLKGRHDACIVPRAAAVVEAATALALLNLMGE